MTFIIYISCYNLCIVAKTYFIFYQDKYVSCFSDIQSSKPMLIDTDAHIQTYLPMGKDVEMTKS